MEYQPADSHNQDLLRNVHPADWTNPDPRGTYDLVILGAGTAGLVTAAGSATLGAPVALVEREYIGGDCLNAGCVPSKALLGAAKAWANVRDAGRFGIDVPSGARVNFAAVMERMRRLRAEISPNDSASRFHGLGVDVYFGPGRFESPRTVEVAGKTLHFRRLDAALLWSAAARRRFGFLDFWMAAGSTPYYFGVQPARRPFGFLSFSRQSARRHFAFQARTDATIQKSKNPKRRRAAALQNEPPHSKWCPVTSRILAIAKFTLLVGFLVGAVYFFGFTETGQAITWESTRDYIQQQDPLAARLIYVAFYIVGTVILLPGTVLSFAGAVLFGVWEGTLYTWIGATIGAVLAFLLAKALGREFVDRLLKGKFQAFNQRIREHGFMGLLVIRLIPLFPFNGVNFGCGLTSIRFRDYLLATAIGILPGTFVYQYLFAKLGTKILEEGFHVEYLWDADLLMALALFLVFIFVGNWLSNRRQRNRAH